jgi:transcriptional regulator with XRE-family HTH domain
MIDLKTWRTKRELTQAQVAEMIGTVVPNVSRIETGNQWPGPELMARIEEATNGEVTASAILQVYREKNVAAE